MSYLAVSSTHNVMLSRRGLFRHMIAQEQRHHPRFLAPISSAAEARTTRIHRSASTTVHVRSQREVDAANSKQLDRTIPAPYLYLRRNWVATTTTSRTGGLDLSSTTLSQRLQPQIRMLSSNSSSDVTTTSSTSSSVATKTSRDGVVGMPIDFDIASNIQGEESQIVTIELFPNQVLRAETGALLYMTDGVEMNTTTGGGMSTGFQRMMTGQNFFISDYTYTGPEGTKGIVALGTDFPSKLLRLNVEEYGGKIVCQKGALLCASHTVDIQMEFTKNFKTGFFGGEGFVLQALTGEGDVIVKAGGTLIRRDLKENEQLRISSGCLVAFVDVEYDVQMVKGFANVFAGGEGLFITTFTGPGTVWLQGQPAQRMISEIARRVPSGGGLGLAVPIGGGSGGIGSDGGDGEGETSEGN